MSSSKSSPKRENKISFKKIAPFELFYQMTYLSAMTAAGISRSKTFELAAQSSVPAAEYFKAINILVDEFRYDYPDACRAVGLKAKSDNMRSFLLRLSDALRSGEPMPEFMAREATVQGQDYQNKYERDLEALKQWTNAYTSISISVALIVIIQVVSSMIYSMNTGMMLGLVLTGVTMAGFGAWIIWRSAPQEIMTVKPSEGSPEQRQALRLFRVLVPVILAVIAIMHLMHISLGWILIVVAVIQLPIGVISLRSDGKTNKKDTEYGTFLRSAGGMATATGTTLKQALTRIDLSSFPYLEPDIERLSTRLQALVEPEVCWHTFGLESGSKLISEVTDIFYGAIKIGGDPERVGYLCSLFASKTSQLRAKRRLTVSTFAALSTVMQAVVAGLMIFVLSIVQNFAAMVEELMPTTEAATRSGTNLSIGMAQFTAGELEFLATVTIVMVILMAVINATAVILGDGGYRFKFAFYLAITILISGICFLVVPPMVAGILTI